MRLELKRKSAPAVTLAILIGATTALLGSTSPAAAAGEVLVSPDGNAFSTVYPGTLFDGIARFVPGDTDQESFYVRNGGSEPGHLRITLKDVVAADADFADALTVSASTVGQAGPAATMLLANPCWVLLQGVTLGAGETVKVTTTLALGDLHGQAGQGATAEFALGVALSSADVALPPTHCGITDMTVPGAPQSSSRGTGTPGAAPAPPSGSTVTPPVATEPDLPVLNLPGLLGIDPNTWRLFEEYFVFLLIGGFIAGTAWFAVVARRRRKNEADLEPEEGAAG